MSETQNFYDNKSIGVSSIVLDMILEGVRCAIDDTAYKAVVHAVILPLSKLADLNDLEAELLSYEGKSYTVEQLASAIHRTIKAYYSSSDDYSAKAEVVVDRVPVDAAVKGFKGVRVHVAG
jgi:hypothetical protein